MQIGDTMTSASEAKDWEPQRYEKFAAERRMPFDDLVGLCKSVAGGVVYDLGCGTGSRTIDLPDALDAGTVVGVDSSGTMLERTVTYDDPRVSFRNADITHFEPEHSPDLILSNAALHWLTDHPAALSSWRSHLSPGGQLAVQIPVNFDHPTQQLIAETAEDHLDWFSSAGIPKLISTNSMSPEQYAEILHTLGAVEQHVMLRVYPHVLDRTLDVVEWLESTTLRPYKKALDDSTYSAFIEDFSSRLIDRYGDVEDFLYTFKRILFWAQF